MSSGLKSFLTFDLSYSDKERGWRRRLTMKHGSPQRWGEVQEFNGGRWMGYKVSRREGYSRITFESSFSN